MHDLMLKVAIMLLSPPKYLFSIEIEISATVIMFKTQTGFTALQHTMLILEAKHLLYLYTSVGFRVISVC